MSWSGRSIQFALAAFLLGGKSFAAPKALHDAAPGAPATEARPAVYTVPRTAKAIQIDGRLDEEAWRDALALELPYEVDPGENTPAPVRTECFVLYDAGHLYVAFRAHDPEPSAIRAHLADRDQVDRDDSVGFVVDTFNDERRGFEMFVNPLGVQTDASRNDVGRGDDLGGESIEDSTWDAIWRSAARITSDGYEVEMEIPFTSLRFPRTDGDQIWGFMPLRAYPRGQRHQLALTRRDRNRSCTLCQAAKLSGFAGLDPGRNLEFDPTLTARHDAERRDFPAGPIDQNGAAGEGGLAMRWGITPNLSLNGTFNPDFSQVEADTAQLTINTRFKLFYPEKRPFFLEGADFFSTPFNVLYTRTASEPAWGIKLTGKEGPHALGLFVARDEKTSLIFPSNQDSNDNSDDASVERPHSVAGLRYRHDIGASSTLGILVTDRQGEGYHNRLYSADGLIRLSSVDTLRFQAIRSDTLYPADVAAAFVQPTDRFLGSATTLRYNHGSRDLNVWGSYEDLGRDFRADTGFIPRVDTRKKEAGVERVLWGGPGAWYTRFLFGVWGWRIDDHAGTLTDQDLGLHALLFGPRQSQLFARVARQKEFFDGTTYDKTSGEFFFYIRPTGDLSLSLGGRLGDAVDYDNSRPATLTRLNPGITCDFGRQVHLQLDHTYERLDEKGGRLYLANLTQLRLVYQMSIRMFARAIVQYSDTLRNSSLYDPLLNPDPMQPRESQMLTQLLVSYKVNPQTLVYIGYSETRTNEDTTDLIPLEKDRSLFFKIGYAWIS